jgi:hypothetical protein
MYTSPKTGKEMPTTVGELRKMLDDMEANWTEEDDKYLGKFNDQSLYCLHPQEGIDTAYAHFSGEFGLILFPCTPPVSK